MKPVVVALAAALLSASLPAFAQTAPPAATSTKPVAPAPTAPTSTETKPPKKPRSDAQKKNDERMRACGKEWRDAKAANKTGGKTWREFSTECRRKKKAAG